MYSDNYSPQATAYLKANRDQSLTLSQNYRHLGLSSKLNAHTGGTEVKSAQPDGIKKSSALAIPSSRRPKTLGTAEIKVIRDPKTGAIISVTEDSMYRRARENPLNDPLNTASGSDDDDDLDEDEEVETGKSRGIVPELEEQAKYSKKKRPRMQSEREWEWVEQLVGKHGDDWGAMVRDRRLNPQQQTEGDIKKRVALWKKERRALETGEVMEGVDGMVEA